MSIIGTGGAAGVAQTAYQAQQVARQRDQAARSTAEAKQLRELLDHMRALEEGDEFESPAQLRVDGQLQDREQPAHDQPAPHREPDDETSSQSPDVGEVEDSHRADDAHLYRHLDVQA